MDKKEFKKMFAIIARLQGFTSVSNFWFIDSKECIFTIELLKSSYGNYYYLTIKIFMQDIFGRKYTICKDLGRLWGEIIRRPPTEYDVFLDLDVSISPEDREQGLELLFDNFVMPFSKKALSLSGVYTLWNENQIIMSEALRNQVEKLIEVKKSQQTQ